MAEGHTCSEHFEYFCSITEPDFKEELRKCLLIHKTKSNNNEINEKYVPASMLEEFGEILMAKIISEMLEVETVMIEILDHSYMDLEALKEEIIKQRKDQLNQNQHFKDHNFPELNFKCKGYVKLVVNFTSVIKQFLEDEISKFVPVENYELNNEESDISYITISMLEVVMKCIITDISSDFTDNLTKMSEYQEENLNTLYKKFKIRMKNIFNEEDNLLKEKNDLLKEKGDLLKQQNDMIKDISKKDDTIRALSNKENEFLKQMNDLIKQKNKLLISINGVCQKHRNKNSEHQIDSKYNKESIQDFSDYSGKRSTSILCRFASRNKKYEILSMRKQAKEKIM